MGGFDNDSIIRMIASLGFDNPVRDAATRHKLKEALANPGPDVQPETLRELRRTLDLPEEGS